jgi:hypothetical protein
MLCGIEKTLDVRDDLADDSLFPISGAGLLYAEEKRPISGNSLVKTKCRRKFTYHLFDQV